CAGYYSGSYYYDYW
nr:immunoglobulin heavy chain junction region [Macaca mulatta]